jgi:putative DNA primase/helicase
MTNSILTHFDGQINKIPTTLCQLPHWVLWRLVEREGKPTKVPFTPAGTPASVSDPNTWTDFETALEAYQQGGFDGIGFVLTWDQYIVCVDLDHAKNGTGWKSEAMEIVNALNSYTEVSPSGEGLHVWALGKLPNGRRRNGNVEMYDSGRFITLTGKHLEGTPLDLQERTNELNQLYQQVFGDISVPAKCQELSVCNTNNLLDDQELLERAFNATNGEKLRALWNGDTSGYQSQSEADLALCRLLAFWCGNDPARIERLFSQSALGQREKWRTRPDYRQRTIGIALRSLHEAYSPKSEKSLYEPSRGLKRDFEEMPPTPTTGTIQTLYGAARGLSEPSSVMAAADNAVVGIGSADTGGGHVGQAVGAEQCPFGPDCPICSGRQQEQLEQEQHPTVSALEEDSNSLVSSRFSDRAETILLDLSELYKNCSTKPETIWTQTRNNLDMKTKQFGHENETIWTQKRNDLDIPQDEDDVPTEQLGCAYLRQPTARDIILLLAQSERSISAKSVSAALGCSVAAAYKALARLAASGELERIGYGEYALRRPGGGAISISEFARQHGISESAARLRLMRMVRSGRASRVANGIYEILPENWQRITATIVRVEQVQLNGVATFRISLVHDGRHFQILADRGSGKLSRIMQAAGLEIGAMASDLELKDILISVCLVRERSRRFYKVVGVWSRDGNRLLWRFDNRNH